MFWVLMILNVLIGIVLTLAILMQASKGAGLTSSFGGGAVGQVFGVRRTSDFLQKFTIGLAGAFMLICLIANLWFLPTEGPGRKASVIKQVEMPTPGQLPPQMDQNPAGAPPAGQ